MLPLAIEFGMTHQQFIYDDVRLFEAYAKAYYSRTEHIAWTNGARIYEALNCAINNIMPSAVGYGFSGKTLPRVQYSEPPMLEKMKTKGIDKTKSNDKEYKNTFNKWAKIGSKN